jgi:hypothetical protein
MQDPKNRRALRRALGIESRPERKDAPKRETALF